jgi:hypothetical protein
MDPDRKARSIWQIWQQVSGILLIDSPEWDASEHVGLLTVIGGMRHVGLFLDPHAERLIRLLRELDLRAFFASGPQPVYDWESPHPPEITKIFRERSTSMGLWVCRHSDNARTINNGVDQIAAGQLLGYPQCCINAQQQVNAAFENALVQGWTREFGDDPGKITQAWLADRKVRIDFEEPDRIRRTVSLFPFVQHMACEQCLKQGDTPTALLNTAYRKLVADVDPALHRYLVRVGKRHGEPNVGVEGSPR